MRKLTEEEANSIPSRKAGKQSVARMALMNMEIGEIILLEKSDWKEKKNQPFDLIGRLRREKHRDFTCNIILDGSGWIIKRLK
jgi:hypothetical protein